MEMRNILDLRSLSFVKCALALRRACKRQEKVAVPVQSVSYPLSET
jgi:hypothetical protein